MYQRVWWISILGWVLLGCSTRDESLPDQHAARRQQLASHPQPLASPADTVQPPMPARPSRSELRVLAEENRHSEAKAQDIIERFDQHLDDPQGRKALQAEFNRLLPAYKANMLKLGKAQLQSSLPGRVDTRERPPTQAATVGD